MNKVAHTNASGHTHECVVSHAFHHTSHEVLGIFATGEDERNDNARTRELHHT